MSLPNYLSYNHLGSLKAVSDKNAQTIKSITYSAYGEILTDTNPNLDLKLGFAGGLYDKDTKLIRFGYRDYDPNTGRWTAKDPIDFNGGDSNLYGYVVGDPVNGIDPMGLEWQLYITIGGYAGFIMGGGGSVTAGVTSSGNVYGSVDASSHTGGGAAGGVSVGISYSECPVTSGTSTERGGMVCSGTICLKKGEGSYALEIGIRGFGRYGGYGYTERATATGDPRMYPRLPIASGNYPPEASGYNGYNGGNLFYMP